MNPVMIQAALKLRGIRQTDIAKTCGVSASVIHDVIFGNRRSRRVEMQIAAETGFQLAELWPEWHGPKATRKRRAAMTRAQVADAFRTLVG